MSGALAGLRRANARHRAARDDDAPKTLEQVATAERRVAEIARQEVGTAGHDDVVTLSQVRADLGNRALVVYSVSNTGIHAVAANQESQHLVPLGPTTRVLELLDHLHFSAERIARPTSSDASNLAAISSAKEVSAELKGLLLQPLPYAADRLVVVPAGPLHAVPWGLVSDVPVETSPSATAWWQARRRTPKDGPALVAHGSGLDHAEREAAAVAAATGAHVVSTVRDTIRMLPSVSHAHFACHARPRSDNPMFSSIVLDDGELTLHDIERLDNVPATIVMASCSAGHAVIASAREVMSLAGAFLSLGARTVVAPLFTVSDEATFHVMSQVQNELEQGTDPAIALAALSADADPVIAFTAGSFVCFGAC